MNNYTIGQNTEMQTAYHPEIAGGINVISGSLASGDRKLPFKAIPFYALGNRGTYPYMVWLNGYGQ